MKSFTISGVTIPVVEREPCYRLIQFFKGQPITCQCSACAARNQTPEQARQSVAKAHQDDCLDAKTRRNYDQAIRLERDHVPMSPYF